MSKYSSRSCCELDAINLQRDLCMTELTMNPLEFSLNCAILSVESFSCFIYSSAMERIYNSVKSVED